MRVFHSDAKLIEVDGRLYHVRSELPLTDVIYMIMPNPPLHKSVDWVQYTEFDLCYVGHIDKPEGEFGPRIKADVGETSEQSD